ncbi:MAG: response regulator [Kiloniellales bacterium]|nr:response regulator [Kiloniellales bacterium]
MPHTVTRAFLRSRYWAATAAILLSLAASVSLGYLELQKLRANAGYFMAFVQLIAAESQLEVEILRARSQSEQGEITAGQRTLLESAYRDLVLAFTALRFADEDGVAESEEGHEEEEEAAWDEIAESIQVDGEAAAKGFDIADEEMPAELQEIWEADEDDVDPALETMIGELIELAHPIVTAERLDGSAQAANIEAIETLSVFSIRPAFEEAAAAIRNSSGETASFAFLVLLAAGIAVGLVALGSALLIHEPMLRTVLESQRAVLADRDKAIASEEAKRRFLAIMSHEIRTPMNGVLGFANLLLDTKLTAQQKEFVETLRSSGTSLLSLLNDILDFSRMESGSLKLDVEDFGVEEILADVVTLLGAQAAAKHLDLSSFVDPSLPEKLRGDPGRLRQILINLVGNAIKFTESGGVTIEIKQAGAGKAGERDLLFAVSDTGIGIAEDKLETIFDRFSQADTSAERKFEGSGLGLAISKELTALMQGEIGVDSTEGKGSTFWVRVRLQDVVPPAETIRKRQEIDIAGRRLLVVDDNALNRRIFKLQLEGFGAEVDLVANAKLALAQLTEAAGSGRPYDLAVIDRMMPETDGIALCKQIRSQPQFLGLRLILASSGIEPGSEEEALGFDASCPKPVLQSALLRTIHELLEDRETSADGASARAVGTEEATRPQGGPAKVRVLLVEDNPVNQQLVTTVLKQAGYRVDSAADGVEAVQAAQRHPYDLILMDVQLPIMNGLEATRRIRSLDNPNADCPILAVTANAMRGDREEYIAAGMDDYITKPIDLDEMRAKIHMALEGAARKGAKAS